MRVATPHPPPNLLQLPECMRMRSPSSSSTEDVYTPPAPSSPSAVDARAESRADPLLNVKLNHARQTVDFVQRNLELHAPLDKAALTIWQAFQLLPDMLPDALAVAEACRVAYPSQPWLHLVALIAPLGQLLTLPAWGSQPAWAVGGESFPVGCRFSSKITDHQYFSVNPDRRNRTYATDLGIYAPNCGLGAVYMSWSGPEYLHMVLALNKTTLPPEALFVARHQRHGALLRGGYRQFMDAQDVAGLQWLERFLQVQPSVVALSDDVRAYYDALAAQFFPEGGVLRW